MRLQELTDTIAPFLKDHGYKKNRLNWYKPVGDITIVFAVQKSQYGSELWYYFFGIGINELSESAVNSASKCCIAERLDNIVNGRTLSFDILQAAIARWEDRFGDIDKLRTAAIEGKLPRMTEKRAITYLTTVHF